METRPLRSLAEGPQASAEVRRPPESLSDYALRSIREDLIEGRLIPGQRIAAEVLATELKISHVPVREALRYLEAEGHLQRGARSHIRVAPVTEAEASEIYHLRAQLEAEAHRVAVPRLTEEDLQELDWHYEAMEAAVAAHDIAAFARANRAFHFVAFTRTGNTWLLRFLNMIWDAVRRYQTSLFQQAGWELDLQRHHDLLRRAMRQHDAEAVNRTMDEHRLVTIEATRLKPSGSATASDTDGVTP